jgi:hypothetical protein
MTLDPNSSPPRTLDYRSAPPPRGPAEHLRVKTILIDVAIVFGATLVGGFIVGFVNEAVGARLPSPIVAAGANLVFGTLAFTLSGMRAPTGNRWAHLAWVALGAWITGLVNVWLLDLPLNAWLYSAAVVAALMGIGGALSMAFKR